MWKKLVGLVVFQEGSLKSDIHLHGLYLLLELVLNPPPPLKAATYA